MGQVHILQMDHSSPCTNVGGPVENQPCTNGSIYNCASHTETQQWCELIDLEMLQGKVDILLVRRVPAMCISI